METCPNCGSEIRPTARFCTSCGYRIPERSIGGAAEPESFSAGWIVPESVIAPVAAETVWEGEPEPEPVSWTDPVVDAAVVATEPAVTVDPVAVVAASGPILDVVAEETINDTTENKVNIALFHIERLKQLVPDITGWSEEQAVAVNKAITSLETSLKGREGDGDPFEALRETVRTAVRKNRDIDVMVALTDRASEIEDLLKAHDAYSKGVREALIAIKPAAVNYVAELKRKPVARKRSSARKTTTTPAPAKES